MIFVVVNRQATHLKNDGPLLSALRAPRKGTTTLETHTLLDLDAAVSELASATTVIFAGGDGTYSHGVTALHRAGISAKVAFAPGGSVSTIARNWGYRGDAVRHTEALLDAVASGRSVETARASLLVDERVGFIWGAGLVARFFDAYYAGRDRGYGAAARITLRIFAGAPVGGRLAKRVLTPVPCTLFVDGTEQHARAYSLMTASVVPNLGLHMLVTYRASTNPDRFHVVASALGPRALGPQMPLVLMGRRLFGEGHIDALASELRVVFDEEDAYVLDGEVLRAKSVTIRNGPRITVLTPR